MMLHLFRKQYPVHLVAVVHPAFPRLESRQIEVTGVGRPRAAHNDSVAACKWRFWGVSYFCAQLL